MNIYVQLNVWSLKNSIIIMIRQFWVSARANFVLANLTTLLGYTCMVDGQSCNILAIQQNSLLHILASAKLDPSWF